MKIEIKNVILREKYLYAFPQVDWKAPTVKKNADPYQPTRSRPWNSSVILGMAVATMVISSATCIGFVNFVEADMQGTTDEENTEQESNDNEGQTDALGILSLDLFPFGRIGVRDRAILIICGRIF